MERERERLSIYIYIYMYIWLCLFMCFCLVTGLVPACHEATANLPPKIIPTKIA